MNKRPKILLLDTIAEEGMTSLQKFVDIIDGRGYTKEQILSEIPPCEGLLIKSNNWITGEVFEKATNLQVIGRAGSGTDNIDLEEAKKHNVEVICSPEGNVCSVSEYVVATSILLCHKLQESHNGSRRNDFRRHTWQGRNLQELVVGVIGLGNIGTGVVHKMAPLSKRVLGYDPYVTKPLANTPNNFELVDQLDQIFYESDIITLHLPLTKISEGLLDDIAFSKMKKGTILINSSRGKIINDRSLLTALKNGTVQAAALDSLFPDPQYNLAPEESTYSHFLVNHPKVYYTPHIAAGTKDALRDVACNLVDKMQVFFERQNQYV